MTVIVSSYHLRPAILAKDKTDIKEITFFHTEIKTCGEEVGEGEGAELSGE